MLVAGVRRHAFAGAQLNDRHPHRHKQFRVVSVTQLVVHVVQDLSRLLTQLRPVLDQRLGNRHEQRRGYALAAHVRHNHAQVIIVQHVEVVEVSADFFCRIHRGIDVKVSSFRERRENTRQHIRLDLCGNVQFRADAFLLFCHSGQVVQVFHNPALHSADFFIQVADLVLGVNRQVDDLLLQVSSLVVHKSCCRLCQHAQRLCRDPAHQQHGDHGAHDHQRSGKDHHCRQEALPLVHNVVHVDVHADNGNVLAFAVHHGLIRGTQPSVFRMTYYGVNMLVGCVFLISFRRIFVAAGIQYCLVRVHDVDALAAFQALQVYVFSAQLFLVSLQHRPDAGIGVIQSPLLQPFDERLVAVCFHGFFPDRRKLVRLDGVQQFLGFISVHKSRNRACRVARGLGVVLVHALAVYPVGKSRQAQ